ncbi:MAG: hypothetical protein AB7N71_02960, partial [Phycisphaerae bacterium]
MDFPEYSWLESADVVDEVLFYADFGELLTLHRRRIQRSAAKPVCDLNDFSDYEAYCEVGLQSLIQRGL